MEWRPTVMAALKKVRVPFDSASLYSFWVFFHNLLMSRRIRITIKMILKNQTRIMLWINSGCADAASKRLMLQGGIPCSGGSQDSPTPPSPSQPRATQRAQGWLRLVMTSAVDFKQTWKRLLARKKALEVCHPGNKTIHWNLPSVFRLFPSYPGSHAEFTEEHWLLWELQCIIWRCQHRGHHLPEKTSLLQELKMAFISSIQSLMTLRDNPPFLLVPHVPDLLLDSQNLLLSFSHWGLQISGILLQVKHPCVAASEGGTASFLSIHSRIIASRFLTHQWNQENLHLQYRFIESGLGDVLTISQPGFPTFPKTRSSIPSPGKGKRSDSLPDSLFRTPCDGAQMLLSPSSKKFSHSIRSKAERVTSWCFL